MTNADHLLLPLPAVHSSWTNKLITAKDHASVQINIGHLNEEGVYTNTFTTFALSGMVRAVVSGLAGRQTMIMVLYMGLWCFGAF